MGCIDRGVRKSEFVAKSQFLSSFKNRIKKTFNNFNKWVSSEFNCICNKDDNFYQKIKTNEQNTRHKFFYVMSLPFIIISRYEKYWDTQSKFKISKIHIISLRRYRTSKLEFVAKTQFLLRIYHNFNIFVPNNFSSYIAFPFLFLLDFASKYFF